MGHCRLTLVVLALALVAVAPAFADDPPAAEGPSLFEEGPLFTPAPQPSLPPCQACATGFTSSVGGGASHWGHGSSCSAAQADVTAQLQAYATAVCRDVDGLNRCSFHVVFTNACWWNGSQYVSDAYANFGCWIYVC